MVSRLLKFFNREFGRLEEAALLLGLSTLVSQLLALFRDRLLAGRFGAGRELDIYYASFRLPDLIYVGVASLVSLSVVIPILVSHLSAGNQAAARRLLDTLFSVFSLAMIVVAGLSFFILPYLTGFLAPGFDSASQSLLVTLSRILLFSPFLLGLSNLLASITQSFKKFFVYALSPIAYNLGIIIGILYLVPRFGLAGLAWGVALGALGHALVQVPAVWALGLTPRPTRLIDWRETGRILKLSLPRTLTLSFGQLVILVLVGMASLMTAGSVAVFNFAYNLQSVPLAIIGMSYSVAAFPTLVWRFQNGERAIFLEQVARAARHIVFWSLPFAALVIVLRAQIIRVILGSGRFDWSDTRLTAASLALFTISLVAQSLILLLVRAYYAAGRTSRPLWINCLSSILIILLASAGAWWFRTSEFGREFLAALLRLEGVAGLELVILPLVFSIGFVFNLWWLWRAFSQDFGELPAAVGQSFYQSLAASCAGGVVCYVVLGWLAPFLAQDTFWGIFLQGLAGGIAAIVVVVICLRLLGNRELAEINRALAQRFWRSRVIVPEPEEL